MMMVVGAGLRARLRRFVSVVGLLMVLCVSCGQDIREGEAARVGFASGYTETSQQAGPNCTMTTEGGGARRARLDCPEVEPETVAAMIEAVCVPLKRLGFRRVTYSSEAGEGRCVVSRCTCKASEAPVVAGVGGAADVGRAADVGASAADGGP